MTKPNYGEIPPWMADYAVREILRSAKPSIFEAMMPPPKPLTRTERFKRRIADYRERLSLAWDALRGEPLYRDFP